MFWPLSVLWTGIFIVSRIFAPAQVTETGFYWVPRAEPSIFSHVFPIGYLTYIVVLVAIYCLSGIYIIEQWNRRPVLFLGKYAATKGPGFTWVDPVFHEVMEDVFVADGVQALQVTNVQTHDNVPIAFNLVLTSRINDAEKYTVEVDDGDDATEQRALSTVTEAVGNTELDKILHDRTKLNETIQSTLQTRVAKWGIQIIAVELKDIKITDPAIEQAIAQKAKASKEADAELVRAEMQLRITQKLKEAAAEFDADTWRLKGMEVLLELCRSANNNTVIIPNDVIQSLAHILPAKTTV